MDENLRKIAITGVSWSAISQVVNQVFTFAISTVLARILGPAVYGLIGMITVFTGFAAVFGDLALGAAIIQRKELEQRHLNSAFWTNLTMGALLTVLMVALAPVVAWFYDEPELQVLSAVLAFKYVIDSLYVVQVAILNREMRFKTLAGVQIGSNAISGLAGLGMALYGMGPWSLIAQTIGASVVLLAVSWRWSQWKPSFSFDLMSCKELFAFSAYVLGFDVVNYWARSLDQLLIGRFIGAVELGIYSRAYNLMLMPLMHVSKVVGRVMFPTLSAIQDDKLRVKRVYLKAISVIGLITFPMMTGLFAVSDHFVIALLGDKWADVIPLIRIFCLVGLIQSIDTTQGLIYFSQGKTGLYFATGLVWTSLVALAFVIGLHWGVIGVALSYAIANVVLWYPSWVFPRRIIGLSCREFIGSLAPELFCAMLMGAFVWSMGSILPAGLAHWKYLFIKIPCGIISYVALVATMRLDSWKEACQIFSDMLGRNVKPMEPFLRRRGNL
jgi:PST family polysaccharide transporter